MVLILKQIKELQERGYNNTQIKMIMKSPEFFTQQIYSQIEGVAATTHEINSTYSEAIRAVVEPLIESSKNEIIEEFKRQIECINQNMIELVSILIKITSENMQCANESDNDKIRK